MVVHVDDVDRLDVVSADLLARLWREGLVVVVATQRSGTATPGVLLAEQRRGGVLRVDLGDLPRPSVSTLLHHVLRGPVAAGAEHTLWDVSRGNPLYLRELVTSAVLAGSLAPADGVWVLNGTLDVSGGLAGLVAERVGHLDADERDLVELLALCAPLGVDELAAHTRLDVLETLETSGVIRVTADQRRQLVTFAHPVHVQVLRSSLTRLRSRRLLLDQVARTEAHGARRRDDVLRVAAWRLDATGTADPRLLVAGAELARTSHDYLQVERLSRAALLLEPDAGASVLLGESLYEQGRFDEADQVLTGAAAVAGDPGSEPSVRIALMHGIVLFFGLGRPDAALDRPATRRPPWPGRASPRPRPPSALRCSTPCAPCCSPRADAAARRSTLCPPRPRPTRSCARSTHAPTPGRTTARVMPRRPPRPRSRHGRRASARTLPPDSCTRPATSWWRRSPTSSSAARRRPARSRPRAATWRSRRACRSRLHGWPGR